MADGMITEATRKKWEPILEHKNFRRSRTA